jgi:hypothetical protein
MAGGDPVKAKEIEQVKLYEFYNVLDFKRAVNQTE